MVGGANHNVVEEGDGIPLFLPLPPPQPPILPLPPPQPELGSIEKPEEIFHIMEHFCLGRRRLHLFGNDSTIRPGVCGLWCVWVVLCVWLWSVFGCGV